MLSFDLYWTTRNDVLCPCCLEELRSDSIVFCDNLAYCPLCSLPRHARNRAICLRIFRKALASDHWASYRRLRFFTPGSHPNNPLQLVGSAGDDAWLLIPGLEVVPPAVADNPLCSGSPV